MTAEKARRSLAQFIKATWHIVEPGTPLVWNWHIDAICQHLEAVTRGDLRRLLINIPPGHMKSLIVSVFWPAWEWIEHPAIRSLFCSYAMDLAIRDSVRCRDLVTSDWYRSNFDWFWDIRDTHWRLREDQNLKSYFENSVKGFRFSMSVGGRATGFRGNKVVVDDPLNAKEQHSQVVRDECIFWWDKVMPTRLNDPRKGARVIIMQRLHEDDLSGHLVRRGGYDHLCLPSEFDPDTASVTSIGWQDPRTERGELLFPEMFPASVLADLKVELGSDGFAGQHQQRPAPKEGAIFKDYWFAKRYKALPKFKEVWTIWDTALKAEEQNDETACIVVGLGEDGLLYILRVLHGRWETPDVAEFLAAQALWLRGLYGDGYQGDYVEDKVSGTTLMQYVRRTHPKLALIPISVGREDKVARAKGVTPLCEAQRIVLPDFGIYPEARLWVEELLAQLTIFPVGKHDDMVDAFVYALKKLMGTLGRKKARRGKSGGMV